MLRTARGIADPELAERLTRQVPRGMPAQRCVRTYGEGLRAGPTASIRSPRGPSPTRPSVGMTSAPPDEEAQALLGEGRCLVALEKAEKAVPVLEQARQIFDRLKAKPALEETEALLGASEAES